MSKSKRWAPVIAALVITFIIATVLTAGLLTGENGEDSSPDLNINQTQNNEQDRNNTLNNGTALNESNRNGNDPPTQSSEFAKFEEIATAAGFDYVGERKIVATGVYIVDFNNNGYEDILAVGGDKPVLFENTGGEFERAQTFDHRNTGTVHFLDYNNNGWRDLIIALYGGEMKLYENINGEFERNGEAFNAETTLPLSMTSADFTGNGCLDVFVGENGFWDDGHPVTREHAEEIAENHPTVRPDPDAGLQNRLFFSDCEQFTEVTNQAGIAGERFTLAVSAADFTGNGYPDIHVGNEFSGDYLYENRGTGTADTFERHDLGPDSDRNAMASVPKDMTGNHRTDIFVTAIYFPENVETTNAAFEPLREAPVPEGNYFLVNEGGDAANMFTDRGAEYGLNKGGWGWAAVVDDFTNDGHLDVIHTTSDVPVEPYDGFRQMQVWQGTADGWTRLDSDKLGIERHEGRGMASLDYNNNGVLDFAVATTPFSLTQNGSETSPFKLYENTHHSNESLQFWIRNPDGVERNAEVYVETDHRTLYRSATANGDFLSQDSRLIHIGTAHEEIQQVQVHWPDGTETVYDELESGNRYILTPDKYERVG